MSSSIQEPRQTAEGVTSARSLLGVAAGVALLSLLGCTRGAELQHAIGRYEVGHYKATASTCAALDDDASSMSEKARVRYLVYCGLAHYKLGHVHEASAMLTKGSRSYAQGSLGWLKPDVVDELLKALDELEGPSGVPDGAAVARSTALSP